MSKPQLFCFTYAGGNKSFFDEIDRDLAGIDLVKIEYAGHGERHDEQFYQTFDELADDMFVRTKELYNGEIYGIFGYSMGSITLVEVLKRIIDDGMNLPHSIFLAAHEPQTKAELLNFPADELDGWVKDRTIKFGAVPEKLLNNAVFWRTYLPIYRADYTIIGRYDFKKLNIKSDVPATVFYSEKDTPIENMKQWDRFFPCEYYQFSGTHFFIQEHHKEMAAIIKKKLEQSYDV